MRHALSRAPSRRQRASAARWRLLLAWLLACSLQPSIAQAQDSPPGLDPSASSLSVANAFDLVGSLAAQGAWQEADAAYNSAVEAFDLQRPLLEAAGGQVGVDAMARVDLALGSLDVALRAEDPTRVRAVVAQIKSELAALAPEAGLAGAAGGAAGAALAWRDALAAIRAFGDSGEWISMRNATLDLHADLIARGPSVAAAGPEAAAQADRLRIYNMRLFAAALDHSGGDLERAASLYATSSEALLVALGVAPAPTSPAPVGEAMVFRAFQVQAEPGQVVSLPIVAQDVPPVGLGGFELDLRWSPAALRLLDVTWDAAVGQGEHRVDEAAGQATLRSPQAPTGPSGSPIVASLSFELRGDSFAPADYLPAGEALRWENAVQAGLESLRLANLPEAARGLFQLYADFVAGRDEAGSAFEALAGAGLAEPLADQLLALVDLSSQPSIDGEAEVPSDLLVQLLLELQTAFELSLSTYSGDPAAGVIPVIIERAEARDTTGGVLAQRPSIRGEVLLERSASPQVAPGEPTSGSESALQPTVPPALATQMAGGDANGTGETALVAPSAVDEAAETEDGAAGRSSGRGGGGTGLALALMALAALAAGWAAWYANRSASEEAE